MTVIMREFFRIERSIFTDPPGDEIVTVVAVNVNHIREITPYPAEKTHTYRHDRCWLRFSNDPADCILVKGSVDNARRYINGDFDE